MRYLSLLALCLLAGCYQAAPTVVQPQPQTVIVDRTLRGPIERTIIVETRPHVHVEVKKSPDVHVGVGHGGVDVRVGR